MTAMQDMAWLAENGLENDKEIAEISQVAHMYYNRDMLQPEIAEKMFFSRSKVSRMLKKARELGIVEIKVRRVLNRAANVEKKLQELFDVREAIVVTTVDGDAEEIIGTVTDFAAMYVSDLLKGNCIMGVSRGSTIIRVVNKLAKVHECNLHAVQLMGSSAEEDNSIESRELVNEVSGLFAGVSHYLNTPLYVDDVYAKEVLLQDKTVQETFNLMRRCNLVLTGLGGFEPAASSPNWYGYVTQRHLAELEEKRAVGSICAQFFNIDGQPVPCEWNEKRIGMPFEYIKKTGRTISVAAGQNKVKPIVGALRGQLLDVLITDVNTAISAIEQQEHLM